MMPMQIENLPSECVKCEQKFISQEILQYQNEYGQMNILNALKIENFEFLSKESYNPEKKDFQMQVMLYWEV